PPHNPPPPPPKREFVSGMVLRKVRDAADGLSNIRDHEAEGYLPILADLNVISGLSHDHQRKLASLVLDTYKEGGSVKWLDPHRREWREWQQHGSRRITTTRR